MKLHNFEFPILISITNSLSRLICSHIGILVVIDMSFRAFELEMTSKNISNLDHNTMLVTIRNILHLQRCMHVPSFKNLTLIVLYEKWVKIRFGAPSCPIFTQKKCPVDLWQSNPDHPKSLKSLG